MLVREAECPDTEEPIIEKNCGAMLLAVAVPIPDDIESWWVDNSGWLAFGGVDGQAALYRLERHTFGTTRGRVLATLMLFRISAVAEMKNLAESGGN